MSTAANQALTRCQWAATNPDYFHYHDHEWGVPVHEDRIHFEYLVLDGFQAGLSWLTILRKRDNFSKAFDDFDYKKIARYDATNIDELLNNPGIVRNKLKINAAINNAKNFIKIRQEFGSFDEYIWGFVDGKTVQNNFESWQDVPATTPLSDRISKDLKQRDFTFVGSTIIYAYMQAAGLVNDHSRDCFRHPQLFVKNK